MEQLTSILQEFPNDPNRDEILKIRGELEDILSSSKSFSSENFTQKSPGIPEPQRASKPSTDFFGTLPSLFQWFKLPPAAHCSDQKIWNTIHLALNQFSPRQKLENTNILKRWLASKNIVEDSENLEVIAFPKDEIIFPGASGSLNIKGLKFHPNGACHPKVKNLLSSNDISTLPESKVRMAQIVSAWMWLSENFLLSHHALESIHPYGFHSLVEPNEKTKYQNELFHRFQRAFNHPSIDEKYFKFLVALDEALQSLVPQPLPEKDSRMGKLREEIRDDLQETSQILNRQGIEVDWKPLWGKTDIVRRWTKRQNDIAVQEGGVRGEILACLRVYASLPKEQILGRVIFRDLRELS